MRPENIPHSPAGRRSKPPGLRRRDPSPCVEGSALDANEGGRPCVRGLDGDRRALHVLDRRLSRWTHWVGVSSCTRATATPTRNAIGLSSLVGVAPTEGDGELSPWR